MRRKIWKIKWWGSLSVWTYLFCTGEDMSCYGARLLLCSVPCYDLLMTCFIRLTYANSILLPPNLAKQFSGDSIDFDFASLVQTVMRKMQETAASSECLPGCSKLPQLGWVDSSRKHVEHHDAVMDAEESEGR